MCVSLHEKYLLKKPLSGSSYKIELDFFFTKADYFTDPYT